MDQETSSTSIGHFFCFLSVSSLSLSCLRPADFVLPSRTGVSAEGHRLATVLACNDM
jgi:hypothetical protein